MGAEGPVHRDVEADGYGVDRNGALQADHTRRANYQTLEEFGNFKSKNEILEYSGDMSVDEFSFVDGYSRSYVREKDSLENKDIFDFADLKLKKQMNRFERLLLENEIK